VVDLDTGAEVGIDQRGELLIKSVMVMKEYWNKPQATADALDADGWFRTGDVATIDQDGFVYIVDRAKDIVIRGGENISCAEVEAAFYSHPAVRECAIFGIPDERLGEVLGLLVYLHEGQSVSTADLLAAVEGKVAKFKIPEARHIAFTAKALPRGATGKIHKRTIKAKWIAQDAPRLASKL